MPQQLLIDGYNLMHAALPLLGVGSSMSLEQKRNAFLSSLAGELSSETRRRTTIVFDAQQTGQFYGTRQQFQSMTILFTDAETEADTVIENAVLTSHGPKSLLIVSSDHRIQKTARRRGSQFVERRHFALAIFEDLPAPSNLPTTNSSSLTSPKSIPKLSEGLTADLENSLDQALSEFLDKKSGT